MEIQPEKREDIILRSRKDNYMISEYREIENEYINIFSAHENCSGYERFYDDKLPGMYAFNVEKHQRKGIGTTMLRSMIEDAISREVRNIYLIADKDDTPRDMYSRLGFETIGEEIELFRALNG